MKLKAVLLLLVFLAAAGLIVAGLAVAGLFGSDNYTVNLRGPEQVYTLTAAGERGE